MAFSGTHKVRNVKFTYIYIWSFVGLWQLGKWKVTSENKPVHEYAGNVMRQRDKTIPSLQNAFSFLHEDERVPWPTYSQPDWYTYSPLFNLLLIFFDQAILICWCCSTLRWRWKVPLKLWYFIYQPTWSHITISLFTAMINLSLRFSNCL